MKYPQFSSFVISLKNSKKTDPHFWNGLILWKIGIEYAYVQRNIVSYQINFTLLSILLQCFYFICCSVIQSCLLLCNPMDWSMPGLPVPHHLLKFAQVHVQCIDDAIQPSHPLIPSLLLPSIFPSIWDFSDALATSGDQKTWSFSFSLSPSNEYSGLISLKMGCFDLLAVQETLRSLLQHHSMKA